MSRPGVSRIDAIHARLARRRRVLMGMASNPTIAAMVMAAAAQYGVPQQLALAVAEQESGLNPNAVSSAGAQGVMQLMPATAAQLGVSNPFDPTQNIPAGVKYLAQLLGQFNGDIAAALAAYNWGPGNVSNAIATYGANWLSYAPTQTQNYVMTIAGISPASEAAALTPPVTIDAATGAVVADSTDTDELQPVNAAGIVPASVSTALQNVWGAINSNPLYLLTAVAVGAYVLASVLGD